MKKTNILAETLTLPASAIEARYHQARACLIRAQEERTEAVCRFLSAQVDWNAAKRHDLSERPADLDTACDTNEPVDLLAETEKELRQAKTIFYVALEQNRLSQALLTQSRIGFQRAQEKMERLAMERTGTE